MTSVYFCVSNALCFTYPVLSSSFVKVMPHKCCRFTAKMQ